MFSIRTLKKKRITQRTSYGLFFRFLPLLLLFAQFASSSPSRPPPPPHTTERVNFPLSLHTVFFHSTSTGKHLPRLLRLLVFFSLNCFHIHTHSSSVLTVNMPPPPATSTSHKPQPDDGRFLYQHARSAAVVPPLPTNTLIACV
uniref:(northern house mosquito) hypothetical protein n=1 Tax=Culex pipiens TaxID=7175 RepID=A0A8D8CCH8_CULPI